ncbi:UNVERIFIED_CONTAM: hypothetical protein GTU68_044375 [Idotea baltica]|nr:hypothetical protein [Idotea baltica]
MKIIEKLNTKGLLQDYSDTEKIDSLKKGDKFYVGFDPTAKSLQLGNLVPLITAIRLSELGLKPIILFGGATAAIGDPSGKSEERPILERSEIENNINNQKSKVTEILSRFNINCEFVNNIDWTQNINIIDFLRDTGKHFPLSYMISKEVIKTRLNSSGISFTEFTYMLLQANDFYHLYKKHDCKLQIGGSDQWGNITAGLELIRRKGINDASAFSMPLITDSNGKKFGKTNDGALWLDSALTSPYKMHQFLLNVSDQDVLNFIKIFTFLSDEEIVELEREIKENPAKRASQKRLADEITKIIHGDKKTEFAKKSAKVLFGGALDGLKVPSCSIEKDLLSEFTNIDLLINSKSCSSKGEAKRLIKNGGAYFNGKRINDSESQVEKNIYDNKKLIILRTGKKSYTLVKLL